MVCHRCQEKKKARDVENEKENRVSSASYALSNALYEVGVNQYEGIATAIEDLIDAKLAMGFRK